VEHEAGIGPAWAAFKAQLGFQQPTRVSGSGGTSRTCVARVQSARGMPATHTW